jgi:hypothetical protein
VATHLDYLLYAQDVGNILRSSWDSWDKYNIYIYMKLYEYEYVEVIVDGNMLMIIDRHSWG